MSNKIIGIDEVGRGPVAGPVYVCSAVLEKEIYEQIKNPETRINFFQKIIEENNLNIKKVPPLRDSKKLSKNYKNDWVKIFKKMRENKMLDYAISSSSNEDIDKYGISKCIKKCVANSLSKISANSDDEIKLDGSLLAPSEYLNQETIIKGDDLEPIISIASIIAKVARDEYMQKQHELNPKYGFDKNMGYGTVSHMDAIKKHGISMIHRVAFLKHCK